VQCDDAQNFLAAFVRADKSKKIDPAGATQYEDHPTE